MAEMIAAGQLAESQKQAISAASEQVGAIRKYTTEIMVRETTSFDIEKVAVNSIYGLAIFGACKVIYHIYWLLRIPDIIMKHPEVALNEWFELQAWASPIVKGIEYAFFSGRITPEAKEVWDAETKDDPAKVLSPIFDDYWLIIAMGIPAAFIMLEFLRIRGLKKKSKVMMKTFEVK